MNRDAYIEVRPVRQPFPSTRRRRYHALATRAIDLAGVHLGWARPVVALTGFWRSGTTWLQQSLAETLGAKTVFEPLWPAIPQFNALLDRQPWTAEADRYAFMLSLDTATDPEIWRYLDLAFHGYGASNFALLCRQRVGDALRRDVVVKCVRMSLGHEAVHGRYGVPIVHIRRHPCAVVSSLMHARWDWSFEDVRLAGLLKALGEDGRRALQEVAPDLDRVVRRHDGDALSRIAAYWALTERYADARLRGRPWARIVSYEAMATAPGQTLADLCGFLGEPRRRLVVTGDSPTTGSESTKLPAADRMHAWRSRMDPADSDRVLEIVAELFPEHAAAA